MEYLSARGFQGDNLPDPLLKSFAIMKTGDELSFPVTVLYGLQKVGFGRDGAKNLFDAEKVCTLMCGGTNQSEGLSKRMSC